jgi:hypothetical protein
MRLRRRSGHERSVALDDADDSVGASSMARVGACSWVALPGRHLFCRHILSEPGLYF